MLGTSAAIVERDFELDLLKQSVRPAADGEGQLVLIDGPAGIGKTQLLAEARRRAAGSMTVLWARASELERDYPFGVVRQLFESVVADPGQRPAALAGAAQAARPVFDHAALLGEGRHDEGGPGEGGSFATL